MNDPMLAVDALDRIIDTLRDHDRLSVPDGCALYAAARVIQGDIDKYLKEQGGHAYASEKLHKTLWSIGAILGFDVTNGHGAQQHRVWALGSVSTLRNVLGEIVEKDPDR